MNIFDEIDGLEPVDPKKFEAFETEMRDVVIPDIVKAVEARQRNFPDAIVNQILSDLVKALQTEQTMHAAWRKRGEEAESELADEQKAHDKIAEYLLPLVGTGDGTSVDAAKRAAGELAEARKERDTIMQTLCITFDPELDKEGSGYEVPMEPEPDYFATLPEAIEKLWEITTGAVDDLACKAELNQLSEKAPGATPSAPCSACGGIHSDDGLVHWTLMGDESAGVCFMDDNDHWPDDGIFKVTPNISESDCYKCLRFYITMNDLKKASVAESSSSSCRELISALAVIGFALHDDHGNYHAAREYLRQHGRYEDNLEGERVLLEVAEVALMPHKDEAETALKNYAATKEK